MRAHIIRHVSYVKFYIGANLSQDVGSHMESGTTYRGQHPGLISHDKEKTIGLIYDYSYS